VLLNYDNTGTEGSDMPGGIDEKILSQGARNNIFFKGPIIIE